MVGAIHVGWWVNILLKNKNQKKKKKKKDNFFAPSPIGFFSCNFFAPSPHPQGYF